MAKLVFALALVAVLVAAASAGDASSIHDFCVADLKIINTKIISREVMAVLESGSPLQVKIEEEPVGRASSFSTGVEGSYTTAEVLDSSQAGPSKYTRKHTRGNTRVSSFRTTDIAAPDDLEAQRHRSQWLSKLKNTLLVKCEEKEESRWDFCILKVPEFERQPSEDYTPVAWQFGLHNRENLSTDGSEALKISYANAFGLVGDKLEKFCNWVVDDPRSILRCYGLQGEASNWSDDVIKYVLALDALFVVLLYDSLLAGEYLWSYEQLASLEGSVLFKSRKGSWIEGGLPRGDMFKFENQIPFELIQRTSKYLWKLKLEALGKEQVQNHPGEEELYRHWEKKWKASVVQDGVGHIMSFDAVIEQSDARHILGLVYAAICGYEGMRRTSDYSHGQDYIVIPSATELLASGIRIEGIPQVPLCRMSYKNNCLYLPKMNMYDSTVSFIRNMAMYERHLTEDRCMFHDYVYLMTNLVRTSSDMDILVEAGVISNLCGTNAIENWNAMQHGLTEVVSSKEHHNMKAAIKRRCGFKRFRLLSEFRAQFLSRPWFVMSTIAVILVTVATLVQTYVAVIGSNRMNPQFPH